jgi:ferric-dicitrate binding protein FerR (iron transport regulator)
MKWLEPPRDAVEAALREALDEAAGRSGDEIAHRRVWTRVAAPSLLPPPRKLWLARLGLAAVVGAAAAGGLLVWPDSPEPAVVAVAPTAPAAAPAPQPALPAPPAIVRQPLLDGPTTIRSDARNRTYLRLWGGTEVDLEPSSAFSLDRKNHPSIDKGRVTLSVPRQKPGHRFTLRAGPYQISVLGTKFQVRVAGERVGVEVEEGAVEVSRAGRKVLVEAGEAWHSPSGAEPATRVRRVARAPERVAAAEPTPPPPPAPEPLAVAPVASASASAATTGAAADQFRQAQLALANGQNQRALEILEALARGRGPAAENAAYEVGRVLRYHFTRPRQALAAWYRYRARFPQGMLRAETDLSIVDALLVVGDRAGALAEADAFLGRHPESERRAEITRIAQQLRREVAQSLSRREPGVPGAM